MSKDKKIVIGIVAFSIFCSSLPMITMLVMGSRMQNVTLWDQVPQQADRLAIFVSMTLARLMNGSLLIPIIGLALSLYYGPRNRKKFWLASVAFALFLMGTVLFAALSTWLEIYYNQQAVAVGQRAAGYSSLNCISTFVNTASWTMLLFVIFSPKFNTNDESTGTP